VPPLVLAHHLIITAYGFWLPNDPRGSWSDFVRAWELFLAGGRATKVDTHRSVAKKPHDRAKRLETKKHMVREPVRFSGLQARAIANGIADYVRRSGCVIYACAIMPDHVHFVIERFRYPIERVARQLKAAATTVLFNEGLHPFQHEHYADRRAPSPWARGEWLVFLDSVDDILRAIRYVNENPTRDGLKPQRWKFVTAFNLPA
jgi:REP element-mobilizing transposase RayT